MRTSTRALLLAIGILTAACQSQAYKSATLARAKSLQVAPEYLIGEGDELTVQILGENQPALDGIIVRPDGKISFPGHGEIQAAGKTPEQLRAELEQSFRETLGLKAPRIHISVDSFASKQVTVLGEVFRPGLYPYTGQMRVTDLLGRAIGANAFTGAANRALLFREIDGNTKMYKVRLDDFFYRGDFSTNFYVRPGDILYVPKNGWAEVNLVITKIFSPIGAMVDGIGLGRDVTAVFIPGTY